MQVLDLAELAEFIVYVIFLCLLVKVGDEDYPSLDRCSRTSSSIEERHEAYAAKLTRPTRARHRVLLHVQQRGDGLPRSAGVPNLSAVAAKQVGGAAIHWHAHSLPQ